MIEIRIPDLGDFDEVEVVELHISIGDTIQKGDPIITLETEKAAMDVPSTVSGVIENINVNLGDKVSIDHQVCVISSESTNEPEIIEEGHQLKQENDSIPDESSMVKKDNSYNYDLIVIGAGPGGYAAAFRASDLGMKVALVDKNPDLGGVCLNVGCIPSKAFLHAAKILDDSKEAKISGIDFKDPEIDLSKMKDWKNKIISGLTSGLSGLAQKRDVEVIHGNAKFISSNQIEIEHHNDSNKITAGQFIIAVGSEPAKLNFLPDDPRILDSTGALEPKEIPKNILIIGSAGFVGTNFVKRLVGLGANVSGTIFNKKPQDPIDTVSIFVCLVISAKTSLGIPTELIVIKRGWGTLKWGQNGWGSVESAVFNLTGLSATASVGTLIAKDVVGLPALSATSAIGSLTVFSDHTLVLPALSLTSSPGLLSVDDHSVGLSGQSAQTEVGSITPADVMGITGLLAETEVGAITISSNPVVDITGQSASTSLGSLTIDNITPALLAGQSASTSLGTLTTTQLSIASLNGLGLTAITSVGALSLIHI